MTSTRIAYLLLFGMISCIGITNCNSRIFRNLKQETFASSLKDYSIVNPHLSFSKQFNTRRISWNTLNKTLPTKLYVKLRISSKSFKIELERKNNLLSRDFTIEDVYNVNNPSTVERPSRNALNKGLSCYYSGYIANNRHSHVAMSVCDGLKGYIINGNSIFLIEPMTIINDNFLHMVYEGVAELNSTHNPLQGRNLHCGTSNYIGSDDITSAKYFSDYPDTVGADQTTDDLSPKRFLLGDENERRIRKALLHGQAPIATIEVFIVADHHMVQFHGSDSIEDYVLTMMNMVSDMYREPSLGAIVNIVVAKLLILSNDEAFNISNNGDNTLNGFCEWQFIQTLEKEKNKTTSGTNFDVAILLTRKDLCLRSNNPCGTIGLAYIGGMCSKNRKCAVIEDIGLNTAYTIAHELGHNLGMSHDGLDNNCAMESASGYPHMMAASWPTFSHAPMKWSKCSAQRIQSFLSSYKSKCIQNVPTAFNVEYQHRSLFPGELYDADTQCKQQYGSLAKHCKVFKTTGYDSHMCKQLWCQVEDEEHCVSKLDPAAKGTPCLPGKWCMYGKCINNTEIPHAVQGGWSLWTNWTKCSRECGVGVMYKERYCDSPIPRNGGRHCSGEKRIYKICNTQSCPANTTDFRSLQCSMHNNGTTKYIPVQSHIEPCALHCRPESNRFQYSFRMASKVNDGTLCHESSSDICIDGRCNKIGCDLKLNSELVTDVCGVCGGNGETCNLVEGKFTQPLGEGYVNVVDIPRGARNVKVQEVKPCPSFLALVSGQGTNGINGNYTIKLPGKYDVNGTTVHYIRRGTQEFFRLAGPLTSKVHFKVLFQGYNFGIRYSYVMPINNATKTAQQEATDRQATLEYGWLQGTWENCSVHCGGGIMRREKPRCLLLNGTKPVIVEDIKCANAKIPPSQVKACNEYACGKHWFVQVWSSCSQSCGIGRKKRKISCKAQQPDGSWKHVQTSQCLLAEKPIAISTCVERSCFLSWRISPWTKCRGECGRLGYISRNVECPRRNACSKANKPISKRRCRAVHCSHRWQVQPWSKCSKKCGKGYQKRIVACKVESTFKIASGKCKNHKKPPQSRVCNVKRCRIQSKKKRRGRKSRRMSTRPKSLKLFNNLKRTVDISAPILNADYSCKKDRMLQWACDMKIRIYKAAGHKSFCNTEEGRSRCCRTCYLENYRRRRRNT